MGGLILAGPLAAQQAAPKEVPATDPQETIKPTWPPIKDRKTIAVGEWDLTSATQETDGPLRKLHGHAQVQNAGMLVRADEIEVNVDTADVTAKGNVYFHSFEKGEQLWCDHMEYNYESQHGKFYDVRGESMPRLVVRRGILSGTSPYHFEGVWAERIGEQYMLYNGWVTNCKMPDPWWKMKGPKFDIIPGERAKAYKSWYVLRHVPVFYFPYFYHSLEKEPRHSGFLIPNLVPRSQRGFMIGLGYFWAINRSYDLTYRFQDYNSNAFGHHVDFRGKPNAATDFDFIAYGVQDREGDPNNANQRFSGLNLYFAGRSDIGNGWHANGFVNYVSSFRFRQEWSESFNEAIGSEIHSVGFVEKDWSRYTFDLVAARLENFQTSEIQLPGHTDFTRNAVLLHKLPEAELSGRDQQIFKNVPVWFSFYSAAGLLYRSEPIFDGSNTHLIENFQTSQLTTRAHFAPHVTSVLRLGGISLVPSMGLDETFYGESQTASAAAPNLFQVADTQLVRSARDFSLDVILPSLSRVFNKKTIFGDKLKHVIEPRATYRYVTGIGDDFNRFIRFDETDLLANTNEVELSLTNRLYSKRGDSVQEIFTWELSQKRYFDPTFGGALVPGRPNVFTATADLSPYSFLLGPRTESPIVSLLRASPISGLAVNWQADYDPYYHRVVDSAVSVDYHFLKNFLVSVGNNAVRTDPLLTPPANQYRMRVQFGDPQHRGWNAGVDAVYDYRKAVLEYSTTQVTYNTDCCGFSVQYRRYNIGLRDESRLQVAFAIANVGTFGTLKKQDRLF